MATIITQFPGEMFASVALRAVRLDFDCKAQFVGSTRRQLSNLLGSSFRCPIPVEKPHVDDRNATIEAWESGSAWPLISLFEGFDFLRLLGLHDLNPAGGIERFGINPEKTLRFCTSCARAQYKEFGVSWWMRDANLPFVAVCPTHCQALHACDRIRTIDKGLLLPHEVGQHSQMLAGDVSDEILEIAKLSAKICALASRIDSNVLQQSVDLLKFKRLRKQFASRRLGMAVQTAHPRVLCANKKPNDGLTVNGLADLWFGALLNETLDESSYLESLVKRTISSTAYAFGLSIEDLLGRIYSRETRIADDIMEVHCKTNLVQLTELLCRNQPIESISPADAGRVVIYIMLLQVLNNAWITQWLRAHSSVPSVFKMSESELCLGLRLLSVVGHDHPLRDETRSPILAPLLANLSCANPWQRPLLELCLPYMREFRRTLDEVIS